MHIRLMTYVTTIETRLQWQNTEGMLGKSTNMEFLIKTVSNYNV